MSLALHSVKTDVAVLFLGGGFIQVFVPTACWLFNPDVTGSQISGSNPKSQSTIHMYRWSYSLIRTQNLLL